MLNRIREVRRTKGLTLQQVADRCDPPTTAQTIGRLETGMRTLSLDWLRRIAPALGVDTADLVAISDRADVPVAAVLGPDGPAAPPSARRFVPPQATGATIGLAVAAGQGDYRAGDQLWLEQLTPADFARALNRDVLVPRPVGRFAFGRLAAIDGTRLQVLPPAPGARQQVIADAPWLGVVALLVRGF